jgi:RNA polymerase sigma-70 factor, ECF subfamily
MDDTGTGASDDLTDRQLVRAYLRTREEEAFRTLYRRHTPALYRTAYRLSGPGLAEEAVQEAWCRAAQRLAGFEWRSTLLTWLMGILIRCCREAQRKSAGVLAFRADADVENEPAVDTRSARLDDIERVLLDLPAGYREVLLLHDVEGFTHDEIARALGIAPGTSKSQLARARRALRRRLAGESAGGATGT